jgi:hypothetical protein
MNEKLKDHDVLLVKEKGGNELHAVNTDKDGKIKSSKLDGSVNPDFLKIDRQGNALENFFENFKRQIKDPTKFEFFRVPLEKLQDVVKQLYEAMKNPKNPENKDFLDAHRIHPEDFTKKQEQAQSQATTQEQPDVQGKTYAISPDLVDWQKLEQRYGVSLERLEKSGNLDKLLNYGKTDLMPVSIKFDDETLRPDARFSLRKRVDGTFTPAVHLIRHQPELERPYFGVKFTEEDKQNLLTSSNLGRVVEAEFRPGEKTPVYLSLDKQTNELVACRVSNVTVPENYKGVRLDDTQRESLSRGEKVEIKGMISTKGTKFDGEVQFNADKRYFELIFNNDRKQIQSQRQSQTAEQGDVPKTFRKKELSNDNRASLREGKTVYVSGLEDRKGKAYTAMLR